MEDKLGKFLFIRKVCYNCTFFKRDQYDPTVKALCLTHNEKVPIFGYCPHWQGHGKVLTSTLLKKHTLEK